MDVARRLGRAALARRIFVGWLMSRLRLSVVEPLWRDPGDTWSARLRSRRQDVTVAIRPVEVEYSGAARSAGSVVRAELAAVRPEARTIVNVTRQADHLLATADWNGASVVRRASQLERFAEVSYLAESLDQHRPRAALQPGPGEGRRPHRRQPANVNHLAGIARQPGLGPVVIVCPVRDSIAARALDLVVDALRPAIARRGEAHLCLTGGSSAAALFARLGSDPRAGDVDWARVHVWQGDERCVPLAHPNSNWASALRDWLDRPGRAAVLAAANRHPVPVDEALATGRDPAWAAARYSEEMERLLPRRGGLVFFDAWLLGVGGDGHILSAFPGGGGTRPV